ncbi:hypothetical protein [Polaribacter batillariae]|uniref:hypothetical protein n=1 Tax=Polaribacter batillariae TaxID=2808900 RepID=UPI001FB0FD8B|nr:hypothetical protein [Polaribacter batillariae]
MPVFIFDNLIINRWIIYQSSGKNPGWFFGVFIFTLWIIGLIGAVQGEEKRVPVLGDYFQKWFKNI